MKRGLRDEEAQLLERVARYAEEYRGRRAAAMEVERERHHANGEVYIQGCWVPQAEAERVARGLQRHEILAFIEISALLIVLAALARGVWWLFEFMFLP